MRHIIIATLAAHASAALTRRLFNESFASASGARCLDSSPAGYFIERGGDPSRVVIFLQGGGACYTPADCAARARTALGSSTYWASTYTDSDNVLSSDPTINPFFNFTRVFVPYCTGDAHLGTRTAIVSAEFPFFFSGHHIVAAVIADLTASSVALGDSRAVLLAGSSAGGIGTIVNADFVASLLPRVANFRAAPQGGWFFPAVVNYSAWVANPNAGPPFAGQDSPAMDLWAAYLPPACVSSRSRAYCSSIDFSFPYIKTPMHVNENLADSNQLFAQLGVPRNESDRDVLLYITAFQDRMRAGLQQVAASPRNSLFAPACVAHTEDINFVTHTKIHHQGRDYNFKDSIASWWFGLPKGIPSVLVDSCDGIACNPTCPPISTQPTNAMLIAVAAAAAPRVLIFAPAGTAAAAINGTLSAVLLGTNIPLSSVSFASDEADLVTGLALPNVEWLVVPDFTALPLGRYWSQTQKSASTPPPASSPPLAAAALTAFFKRGGNWLVSPGSLPTGYFIDLPLDAFSLNVFSAYEAYIARGATVDAVPALGPVDVASAMSFAFPSVADFAPALRASDARNRTVAIAASRTRFFTTGACWVLAGLVLPDALAAPAFVSALTRVVSDCAAPPPPPPPADACPCAARGSAAAPLLPRLALSGAADAGRHFVYPNGSAWLALGADIFRDATVSLSLASVGALLHSARTAGANMVRLYGFDVTTPQFACALDCATVENIYLLQTVDGHVDFADADALRAHAAVVARAVANESVVIGVDFDNEPYVADISAVRMNATTAVTLAEFVGLDVGAFGAFQTAIAPGAFSTFPALADGRVPVPHGFEAFYAALNAAFATWASWYIDEFARVAPATQLCVGFNTWPSLLPSLYGHGLSFTCNHAYADSGEGYDNATVVSWVPTLLDRLALGAAANGAPRPVLLGETGSSNGETMGGGPDGALLDFHSAAVFDALPHLLSLAHGHAGATRWAVADVPFAFGAQQMKWLGNVSEPAIARKYLQQGRFGLGSYDGTAEGVLKPTAFALQAIRGLLDDLQSAGALQLGAAGAWRGWGDFDLGASAAPANAMGTRFVYSAPGALIVGDAAHADDALSFSARAATVVAVRWAVVAAARARVCVVATADVVVRVNAAAFAPGERPGGGGQPVWSELDLLAGVAACL